MSQLPPYGARPDTANPADSQPEHGVIAPEAAAAANGQRAAAGGWRAFFHPLLRGSRSTADVIYPPAGAGTEDARRAEIAPTRRTPINHTSDSIPADNGLIRRPRAALVSGRAVTGAARLPARLGSHDGKARHSEPERDPAIAGEYRLAWRETLVASFQHSAIHDSGYLDMIFRLPAAR